MGLATILLRACRFLVAAFWTTCGITGFAQLPIKDGLPPGCIGLSFSVAISIVHAIFLWERTASAVQSISHSYLSHYSKGTVRHEISYRYNGCRPGCGMSVANGSGCHYHRMLTCDVNLRLCPW